MMDSRYTKSFYTKASWRNYCIYFTIFILCLTLTKRVEANSEPTLNEPVDPQINENQKCQPTASYLCTIESYTTIQPFNNSLGHRSLAEANAELFKYSYLFAHAPCNYSIQLFLCSLYLPVCVTQVDHQLLPCRDECELARSNCASFLRNANQEWPEAWNCNKFPYQREDRLCVINNQPKPEKTRPTEPSSVVIANTDTDITMQPPIDHIALMNFNSSMPLKPNKSPCALGLFDCQMSERPLCIDQSYVCNGKSDCILNGNVSNIDELDCPGKCRNGGIFCDNKCQDASAVCNGMVDCSSAIDEQCREFFADRKTETFDTTSVIVSLVGIFTITTMLVLSIYKLWSHQSCTNDDKPYYSQTEVPDEEVGPQSLEPAKVDSFNHKSHYEQPVDHQQLEISTSIRYPIYNEPAYSVQTKITGDYERVNVGGYSGASSVYAYGVYNPIDDSPAPPPPTPAPEIYSTGPITLYENVTCPNDMDLLS